MADDIDNETVLLLLGRTGAGKSATGNTIMGKEAFGVKDSCHSVTKDVDVDWTRRHGRNIMVVDGIGLGDTRMNRGEHANTLTEGLFRVFTMCPRGFHSILLVLRYGARFTSEDRDAVNDLKLIFGHDFIQNFCIIVFTYGDSFDLYNRKYARRTFQDWCRQQEGSLQMLFQECNNRVVLFHNLQEEKQEANCQELFNIVDQLTGGRQRYTHEQFREVALPREQYIVRHCAPQIREEIQRELDQLNEDLDRVKNHNGEDEDLKQLLNTFVDRAGCLLKEILTQDKGTGVLNDQKELLERIMKEVAEIEVKQNMMQAEEKKPKPCLLQ